MEKGQKITIHFHRTFQKRAQKYSHKRKAIEEAIALFQKNYTNPKLKTHKLIGQLEGNFAFSVDYHLRIMFCFEDKNTVLFLDIGTHEIYR